jgi:hypothetical protein
VGFRRLGGAVDVLLKTRVLGASEAGLQAGQVVGDQLAARLGIRGGKDRVDLLKRHVEVPEAADYLGGCDLPVSCGAATT